MVGQTDPKTAQALTEEEENELVVFILVLYVLAMLGLGYWAMRKTKNVGDFFLGGRTIGAWMSAFAYGTTYFSAVLFIGYAGKLGWGFGLHTMWIVAGNVLFGSLLAWWVLGKRTREMTARLDTMTMPAFFAERFKSPALKVSAAILIFLFLIPYSASVYMGLSYLFEQVLGITYMQSVYSLALLTGVYLVLGGYFAVTLTDFLMGLIQVFGVSVMLIYLTGKIGGFVTATKLLTNCDMCSPALQPGPPGAIPGWLTLAALVILTSIGPWGLPQMVQKFYSIKSAAHIKRAMIVASVFAVLMTLGGYYTGALTHLNIPNSTSAIATPTMTQADASGNYTSPKELPMKSDGKTVDWDRWMPKYLINKVPGWILIVILLLIFSASMSSLSSLVLVSSSAIAMDLYAGVLKPDVEKKSVLVLMRALCGLFVAVSLAIAIKKPLYIINLMVISWGVLAGGFAAPYLYGLFSRRVNAAGAGAGMFTGVGTAVALYWYYGPPGIPVAGAAAILVPFIIVPIVSALTRPMPDSHVSYAFGDEEGAKKEEMATPV